MVVSLLLTSCVSEPTVPSNDEAMTVIKDKVQNAAERWASGDVMGYVDMVAEDATYMDDIASPELLVGREKFKAYAESLGNVPPHKPILSAFHWQFYDEIVVLTYRYQGDFDGQLASAWRITSVFRFANNDWLSVHENWSLVKEPEGESDE
ncbi:MAG: nuclear transport factor 2 family protein [Bacteroidota bacterium]